MIYLLLSIISTSLIFIIFKWMGKLNMNNILVIVMNYLVAGLWGWALTGSSFISIVQGAEWLWPTVLLGSCFVGMFYLMAIVTQRSGASAAVVANKMSVVIPVIFAFVYFGDNITLLKVSGIVLALLGILFATRKKGSEKKWGKSFWLLFFVFLGSGLIDCFLKVFESFYLSDEDILPFTSVLFLMAFLVGTILLSFKASHHISSFYSKKAMMGLLLGSVNFGSIYFLVLALGVEGMESSILFPLNNIGVVVLSTVLSIILFKEHLQRINYVGISLSIAALILLILAR